MRNPKIKRYVIRKYVFATSIRDALRKEKGVTAEDVNLDEQYNNQIGFKTK